MFSAGRVHVPPIRQITVRAQVSQSGFPAQENASFNVKQGVLDVDIVDRGTLGQNMGNPYGIAGQQGPAINIPRVARAIRGRETPAIVTIDRRVDPQYQSSGQTGHSGIGGRSIHGRQQYIPGKQDQSADPIVLNEFEYAASLQGDDKVPESLSRHGKPSQLAGGQTGYVGMVNTTRSSADIDESLPPVRIPRFWNDGLNAAAGLAQYAFTQQNYRIFIKHPWLGRTPFPTRGIRSISGVTAQQSTASTIRIPAIYVPSAVG